MPLLGGVVLEFRFLFAGKETGPHVRARFKITEADKTDDWCPIILGGRALDCSENGGLGFIAGPASYWLTGISVEIERYQTTCTPITNGIYAQRVCSQRAVICESAFSARPSCIDEYYVR